MFAYAGHMKGATIVESDFYIILEIAALDPRFAACSVISVLCAHVFF